MGPLSELVLAYHVTGFGATRGTTLSALEIMAGGDFEYEGGAWRTASPRLDRGSWDFGGETGVQRMVKYPAGEQVTVPRHVTTAKVITIMSSAMFSPHPLMRGLVPAFMGGLRLVASSPARRAFPALIRRMPEGPSDEARRRSRFEISCEARGADGSRRRSGALAPSQAFEPRDLMAALGGFGVTWEIEALAAGQPAPA